MKILAITTTKTSKHKDAAEYFVADFGGSLSKTLEAAKAKHPRKRKFFKLVNDGRKTYAAPLTAEDTAGLAN